MDPYRVALILVTLTVCFAVARLLVLRVPRDLPVLFSFLLYQLLQYSLAIVLRPGTKSYEYFYIVAEPVNWIFFIFAIREMYDRVFAEFPGIASTARAAVNISLGCALGISFVMVYLTPANPLDAAYTYVVFWEKCMCFALAAFIVFMIFVLSRYPLKVRRNEVVSISLFALLFVGNFLTLQIPWADRPNLMKVRNYLLVGLSGLCYLAWGVLVRKPSPATVQVRTNLDDFEERRLLDQLAVINRALIRPSADNRTRAPGNL